MILPTCHASLAKLPPDQSKSSIQWNIQTKVNPSQVGDYQSHPVLTCKMCFTFSGLAGSTTMSRFLAVFCSHFELVVRAYIIEQSRPVDLKVKEKGDEVLKWV